MNLGQIYTKTPVADFMVSLFSLPADSRILDPCFGGGVFIDSIAKNTSFKIDGIELDPESYLKYAAKENLPQNINLFCDNFFNHNYQVYDGIIMNPPYVRHEEIDLMDSIGVTKTMLRNKCSAFNIPSKANLYIYFILYSIMLLRQGGQLIVIFPNVWQKNSIGTFLNKCFSHYGFISKHISVKGNPFDGAPLVEVCILKFIKSSHGKTDYTTINADDSIISETKNIPTNINITSDYLIPLHAISSIRRGMTTFNNKMFINPPSYCDTFVRPIISSPKSINGFSTTEALTDRVLILPPTAKPSKEICQYTELWKEQILKEKKPLTLYNRIRQNRAWFSLTEQDAGNFIFPYIIRYQPIFIINEKGVMARDNFYVINSNVNSFLLFALLNNYYTYYQLELLGKTYGNGILKIQKYDVDAIKIVDHRRLKKNDIDKLISLAKKCISDKSEDCILTITKILEPYFKISNIFEYYINQKKSRLSNVR